MKEIFDNYIRDSFRSYEQATFKFDQFGFNYRKYFPPDKGSFLLDIGIGRGEMLSLMKRWGYENHLGIDISPDAVQYCQSLGLNCLLVEDSTQWLETNPGQFSLITLLDVLEHVPKGNSIPFLKALRCSLADDGNAIIQVPNLQAPDGQLHRYHDFTHEVGFVEDSLHQVLLAADFRNISFHGFETFIKGNVRDKALSGARSLYWATTRFLRRINGNLNPEILNPVFYAIAGKQ